MGDSTMTCVDILFAIILPPFLFSANLVEFWICVLLTLLGWLPGIISAFWVLNSSPSDLPLLWWIFKGPVST
ncbi:hypothetical protein K7X08_036507 [Anisodus acutangulus]|uniref:Uncharacterized protein n=1 Tax=Anisodus acutangulus TaxID=402998 RepID=A0A9Q1L8F5_9SOLA|nr:hypothetical protein K7X08_036507 [Anisodus acutangulus]